MVKTLEIKYLKDKYPVDVIRYVFYTLTDRFWIIIDEDRDSFIVKIYPKGNLRYNSKKLKEEIKKAFDDEMLRKRIFDENEKFREFLLKKAITFVSVQPSPADALTPEEEKELERLIKEVEEELKEEMKKGELSDIKKTWEEVHARKDQN